MTQGRALLWLLGVVAAVGALASEAGRLFLKGQDYAYSSFNDLYFYTAMVFNLWGEPISVGQEVAERGFSVTNEEWLVFYGGRSDFWATHVHPENGLSHQPPWAYRIVVPSLAAGFRLLGIPLDVAYLIIYVASAVLLAVSVFRLLRPFVPKEWWAAAVALGVLTAALAATSPGYPDMTFLGLASLAVLYAYRQQGLRFALAGLAAGLTRETAVLLAASWLMVTWARGNLAWKSTIYAIGPLAGVLAPRFLVEVPNSTVDYLGMIASPSTWTQVIFWSVMAFALVAFTSPVLFRWQVRPNLERVDRVEAALVLVAGLFVLAAALLSLASSRMALLVLPLLLAPTSWRSLRSHYWVVASLVATIGYAVGDTLASRGNPPLGPFPWLGLALLAVGLKIVALHAERNIGEHAGTGKGRGNSWVR